MNMMNASLISPSIMYRILQPRYTILIWMNSLALSP